MAQRGEFVPAGEKERIEELQTFISNLQIRVHLFANSISNVCPVTAYLPKEREKVLSELQYALDTKTEMEMMLYRANLKSLGQSDEKENAIELPNKKKAKGQER